MNLPLINDARWHDNAAIRFESPNIEQILSFRYRQIWLPPLDPSEPMDERVTPQRAYVIQFPSLNAAHPRMKLPDRIIDEEQLRAAYVPDALIVALYESLLREVETLAQTEG